ncbi:alpha-S1-casein [Leptonychotes weddellii]|uniref:Alpha-S1-casein n=1 Tax=Leptonychotes weddellii TaxID=9713 RepID=A0A7F8QFW6_LEPWE|nr:alpha-S1-casein [Leptonychotes weddellii]
MRFLILTCLVAVVLARPKLPLRHPELIQNEPDYREEVLKERQFPKFALPKSRELREEYLSELSKQRELLREKHNDVLKGQAMEDPEQKQSSSSSSSEEVVPNNTEHKQIPREDTLYQRHLEQLHRLSKYNKQQLEAIHNQQHLRRVKENNLLQLPFQQFYQLDAYPFAAWYYIPQIMQYIAYQPSYDITKPIASENVENVDVVPEW